MARLSGLSARGGLARMEYEQGEGPLFIPPWCATAFAFVSRGTMVRVIASTMAWNGYLRATAFAGMARSYSSWCFTDPDQFKMSV